ncbi:MAG: hypothetical protein HKN42_07225 [Granulosicoccus sp.]|nr:hypothetical protein [Granulosicoccus sp.]
MCHLALLDTSFWVKLFRIDQRVAELVRSAGCQRCDTGGALHVANYPRKPRGEHRTVLGPEYDCRLSFCCAACRRRTTPPSVRFLGRKVYLGAIISLISAGADALSDEQLCRLIEALNLPVQTLYRWRLWWSRRVPASACWRALSGWFSPPISPARLPGELLVRLHGSDMGARLIHLLQPVAPLTTGTGPPFMRVGASTYKM